jgi:hypothetical protein
MVSGVWRRLAGGRRHLGRAADPFWRRFLQLVDAELVEPHEIVVLGGAAIGKVYAPSYETEDLDSTTQGDEVLRAAVGLAREKMRERDRLEPPEPLVQFTMVFNRPHAYEDRLRPLRIRGLRHLRLPSPSAMTSPS